jgi:ryanodine receptor 2
MNYKPEPIDTSHVALPAEVLELRERLAAHAHDVWARQRLKEGWTHGPHRDDKAKKHPCLVPYDELPETEKEYDRSAALETLKLIIALGYTIQKS